MMVVVQSGKLLPVQFLCGEVHCLSSYTRLQVVTAYVVCNVRWEMCKKSASRLLLDIAELDVQWQIK